jgi:DNA-binding IclR family transcriptional regulator
MGSCTDQIGRSLVERLGDLTLLDYPICQEAKAEIERLRAERDEAVSALPQAVRNERERCAMEVWCAMQEATAEDADDKGLEGWMREAEQRIRQRA